MLQHLLIIVTLWCACLADLGWDIWTEMRIAPVFLDLAVVAIALLAKPRSIILYGGLAGILSSIVHAVPIILSLPLFATVSLIAAWYKPSELKRLTLAAGCTRSLLILSTLLFGRIALQQFPEIAPAGIFQLEQIARIAFTFVLSLLLCISANLLQRRSIWD